MWYPQWEGIDFAAAALEHYAATGRTVGHFAERLPAYELDIGLGNLGWFTSRRKQRHLERAALQTRRLAEAPLSRESG